MSKLNFILLACVVHFVTLCTCDACTEDDIAAAYTSCDTSGKRNLIYYKKVPCEGELPANVFGLRCGIYFELQ